MTTFVLIPGAGGMASYWQRLVPLLREAGHDAIAVDLPGDDPNAGLPEYAALVRAAVDRAATDGHGDVTLVAQSLGGFTAPLAAAPPVSAIVFVNAMIPVPGETPGAWWDATGQSKARIAAAERHGYGTGFDLPAYFLHDVPESVLASAEEQRDESDAVFASVCDFTAWPAIPVKVVAGAGDRFFPLEFQQRVARERLDLDTDVLPGGHLIALSRPGPLARYLVEVSGLRQRRPSCRASRVPAAQASRRGDHVVASRLARADDRQLTRRLRLGLGLGFAVAIVLLVIVPATVLLGVH